MDDAEIDVNEVGKRKSFNHEGSSVRLTIWSDGLARVSAFISRTPGKGYGTVVFNKMLNYADKHELSLFLTVQNYTNSRDILSNEQLIAFYEKHGFVKDSDKRPIVMSRAYR